MPRVGMLRRRSWFRSDVTPSRERGSHDLKSELGGSDLTQTPTPTWPLFHSNSALFGRLSLEKRRVGVWGPRSWSVPPLTLELELECGGPRVGVGVGVRQPASWSAEAVGWTGEGAASATIAGLVGECQPANPRLPVARRCFGTVHAWLWLRTNTKPGQGEYPSWPQALS